MEYDIFEQRKEEYKYAPELKPGDVVELNRGPLVGACKVVSVGKHSISLVSAENPGGRVHTMEFDIFELRQRPEGKKR